MSDNWTISGQISIVNGEKGYHIVPGKRPYLRKHPTSYFSCSVVWAVLHITAHHEICGIV